MWKIHLESNNSTRPESGGTFWWLGWSVTCGHLRLVLIRCFSLSLASVYFMTGLACKTHVWLFRYPKCLLAIEAMCVAYFNVDTYVLCFGMMFLFHWTKQFSFVCESVRLQREIYELIYSLGSSKKESTFNDSIPSGTYCKVAETPMPVRASTLVPRSAYWFDNGKITDRSLNCSLALSDLSVSAGHVPFFF